MVNWGVIGGGGIARRRTIPEGIIPAGNARLKGIMDSAAGVVEEMSQELNVPGFTHEDELLKDESIQAVYIATPVHVHAEQVTKSLRAGKHVLVEKPMAMTMDECESLVAEAQKHNAHLGMGFMMRFHGLHQKLRQMVVDGNIGKPVLGRAQLSCWYPPMEGAWRQNPKLGGGGSLIDMGGHLLDLLEYIFNSQVQEVSCYTARLVQSYESEDSSVTMVRFRNGAIGVVDAFFDIHDNSSKNVLEIYGSKGSVLTQGTIGQGAAGVAMAYIEADDKGYDAQQQRAADSSIELDFPQVNLYQAEIEEFSAAIEENREPAVSVEDALWSQKLLLAAYASARTGKSIKV